MLGQAAVRIAEGFHAAVGLTGLVLTKMDGDARGGAAISIRSVAAVPIKFLGVSEKMDGLEVFDPGRLAGRILGMGDIIGLIEKAEASFDIAQAQQMQQKLLKSELDLNDFLDQLRQMRKLGSMGQLMEMLPGLGRAAAAMDPAQMDRQLTRSEAIVCSMTLAERRDPRVMNSSRKRRVAAGSGTQVQDVNQLLKQFRQMQDMMKQFGKNKRGMLGLLRQLGG
jgi:signal recognition particle subunit SRP54